MLIEEINDIKENYKIYVDLDGVMADFLGKVSELVPDYTQEKYQNDPKYRSKMWKIIGEYSKDGGKLWFELKMMPDAKKLWNYLKKLDNVEVLSATGDSEFGAAEQKREWVKKYLGNVKVNLVNHSGEKAKFATPNHILIDDMGKSINPWKTAGGIGILHTSAAETIKELKKLGL